MQEKDLLLIYMGNQDVSKFFLMILDKNRLGSDPEIFLLMKVF